jgi:nucleotide-binding universal stress UspA family protein
MYKSILVPLDGSKRAEAILPHVEELARRYEAKVILLQVIEPTYPILGTQEAYAQLYEQSAERRAERAAAYLATLQDDFDEKGIETKTLVGQGPVLEEIHVAAASEGADLIAIASHGRTGLSRVFYGSVAAGVLHRVDRPLLLIRSRDGE